MLKFLSHRAADNTHGIFRQVPLTVKGRLYVSPMPFGAYDTGNRVLKLYKENKINHVFLIATDEEIRKKPTVTSRRITKKSVPPTANLRFPT